MLAIDTECTGLDFYHGAMPYLVTICDEDQNQTYWEWNVDPLTRKPVIIYNDLKEIERAIKEADRLVFQNSTFDVKALSILMPKFNWPWDRIEDTLYSAHLLASNKPKNLTSLALQYLSIDLQPYEDRMQEAVQEARRIARRGYPDWRIANKDLSDMPSAKEKVWKFDCWLPRAIAKRESYPSDHLWWAVTAEYANADSAATVAIAKRHRELLKERNLEKIYRERIKMLPIVSLMQQKGITVSEPRLTELYEKFTEGSDKCHRICLNAADNEIEKLPKNGVSNDLKKVLFDKFGLVSERKTKKGNPSVDKFQIDDWLLELNERGKPYLFIKNLKDYRKQRTCLSYLDAYRKYKVGNRLYSSVNPTGTDTLRWSSSNPNQTQISKIEGYNLRYCFGPAKDREWWSLDYNNIELRIPAYEAGEEIMIKVFEKPNEAPYFGSYHLLVFNILHPEKWNHDDSEGLLKAKEKYKSTWYGWIKAFNFADQYGAVPSSGTADRAAHVEGAQIKILNKLKKRTKLADGFISMANRLGYVETIPDKEIDPKRGYPLLCTRSEWGDISPTVPFSYHVQGTACWVMFRAMIKVQKYLDSLYDFDGFIALNVHDEIVLDFPYKPNRGNLPKIRRIRRIMESLGDCIDVPLTCGTEYHEICWSKGVTI